MPSAVSLSGKLATFQDHWAPRTVASFNGHDVMVVKIDGPFIWHKHDDTDDFFLVLDGDLTIEIENASPVRLGPGDLYIVPKGVLHRPIANGETHVLLIERAGTPNMGDAATAAPRREI